MMLSFLSFFALVTACVISEATIIPISLASCLFSRSCKILAQETTAMTQYLYSLCIQVKTSNCLLDEFVSFYYTVIFNSPTTHYQILPVTVSWHWYKMESRVRGNVTLLHVQRYRQIDPGDRSHGDERSRGRRSAARYETSSSATAWRSPESVDYF